VKRGKGSRWIAVAAALCTTLTWSACSTAWITQAEQIVAALIPAVSNVLTLVLTLEGKSISVQDAQSIQSAAAEAGADLQLIESLITQYKQAESAAKPGILNQVSGAIQATQASLDQILTALHVEDAATQAKIAAVVGVVQSELQSLTAVLPATSENPAVAAKIAARMGHPGAPLGPNAFVGLYNATMTAKTGNADVDRATASLQIHLHGRLARWVTAGWMK